jgi:hypothetical protein
VEERVVLKTEDEHPLPVIRIPLRRKDEDIQLDLQAVLQQA